MIKRNYYKVVRVYPDPSSYFYIKNESMSDTEIQIMDWVKDSSIQYSFDKVNWNNVDNLRFPADSYVYLRNTSNTLCSEQNQFPFIIFKNISLGGDIRTLFNYTDVDSVTAIPAYGLSNMFSLQGSAKITDISNLSFRGITSIGENAFGQTFTNSSITKGIDLRDVTTLGEGGLYMMYYGASNLTEVYAPNVSTWDTNKTESWLASVSPTGVVYKPSTLTIPQGQSGIPYGWTTQDYPTI